MTMTDGKSFVEITQKKLMRLGMFVGVCWHVIEMLLSQKRKKNT
jgi:hypothetical protein